MREPIGMLQRTLAPAWVVDEHLHQLARRYGVLAPRRVHMCSRQPRSRRYYGTAGPYVKVGTLRRLLEPLIGEVGLSTVADLAGTTERQLYRVMHENRVVTMGLADALICDALGDPSLWHTEPGLELVDVAGRLL